MGPPTRKTTRSCRSRLASIPVFVKLHLDAVIMCVHCVGAGPYSQDMPGRSDTDPAIHRQVGRDREKRKKWGNCTPLVDLSERSGGYSAVFYLPGFHSWPQRRYWLCDIWPCKPLFKSLSLRCFSENGDDDRPYSKGRWEDEVTQWTKHTVSRWAHCQSSVAVRHGASAISHEHLQVSVYLSRVVLKAQSRYAFYCITESLHKSEVIEKHIHAKSK